MEIKNAPKRYVAVKPGESIGSGQKTVAAAGTAEVLGSSTATQSIIVKALAGNTGNIYVGGSGVTSSNGFVLAAGDTVSIDTDNLSDVYIDADNSGEGVSYLIIK